MKLGVRPENRVSIELRRGDEVERLEFGNLVLDVGWNALVSKSGDGVMVPKWLYFGTGDTEPTAEDAGLENRVTAGKAHTSIAYGGLVDAGSLSAYSEAVVRFDFAPGELSGVRWTELGLSYGSGYSEPYNRALIRDEADVPTPLVCLEDQSVTVYVRLRLYLSGWGEQVSLETVTGTINLLGDIQSTTQNLWRRGFPIDAAVMGGLSGIREGYSPPSAKFYFVTNANNYSASSVTFYGQNDAALVRLDFDPPHPTKPNGWVLHFRIGIEIVRGTP